VRRGFGSENAIVTYARGSPEARQGFAVFAVRLVFVIMGRAYAGDFGRRQRGFELKFRCNEVEQDAVVTP
jgi:hypothetical protein